MIDWDNGYIQEGHVDDIPSRNTSAGLFYNVVIDGETFGYGKYPPKFGVGGTISANITWRGDYANIDTKSVEILDFGQQRQQGGGQRRPQGQGGGQRGGYGGPQQRPQGQGQRPQGNAQGRPQAGGQRPPAQRGGQSGGNSKDTYWEDKAARDIQVQAGIQWQASRNSAIALVDVLLKNGMVSGLPTAKGKQADAIVALVDEYTEVMYLQTDEVMKGKLPSQPGQSAPPTQAAQQQQEGEFDDDIPAYQEDDYRNE